MDLSIDSLVHLETSKVTPRSPVARLHPNKMTSFFSSCTITRHADKDDNKNANVEREREGESHVKEWSLATWFD